MTRDLVSPSSCPLPGRWGGRFVLGALLGRGPGSEVYRATDTLLDRAVAVKIWPIADGPAARTRLRALTAVVHPHLAPVYEVGTAVADDGSRACLVTALYEGGSFAARHADGRLGVPAALHAGAAVADVLDRLHQAGLAHRRVTPTNILFDDDGRPHLADVGAGERPDDAGDPPADVHALGALLRDAASGLPDDVDELLAAMTAEDAAARPSASDVARRLRQAAVDLDPPPVIVLPRARAPRAGSTLLDTAATPVVGAHRATVAVGGGLALLTVLASVVLVGALLPQGPSAPAVTSSAALAADHFGPFSDDAESAGVPVAAPIVPATAPDDDADPAPARSERRTERRAVVVRTVREEPEVRDGDAGSSDDGSADGGSDGGSGDGRTASSAGSARSEVSSTRSSGAGGGSGNGFSSVVQQGAGG